MASSQTAWNQWLIAVHVKQTAGTIPSAIQSILDPVSKIVGKTPARLARMGLDERARIRLTMAKYNHRAVEELFELLTTESSHLDLGAEADEQLLDLVPAIMELCCSLNDLDRIPGRNEADWCRPVDSFFLGVFERVRPNPIMQYGTEFAIALPFITPQYPTIAILDGAVVALTDIEDVTLETQELLNQASCTVLPPGPSVSVLQWVVEFEKEQHGFNQLTYGLTTAQKQRSAMGIIDEVVYGAAITNCTATVYASWWEGEDKTPWIRVGRVAKFDLASPLSAVQFTVLLLKIKTYLAERQSLLETLHVDALRAAQDGKPTWRETMPLPAFLRSPFKPTIHLASGSGNVSTTQAVPMAMMLSSSDLEDDEESVEVSDEHGETEEHDVEVVDSVRNVKSWVDSMIAFNPHGINGGEASRAGIT